jgi:hypothetical protein
MVDAVSGRPYTPTTLGDAPFMNATARRAVMFMPHEACNVPLRITEAERRRRRARSKAARAARKRNRR